MKVPRNTMLLLVAAPPASAFNALVHRLCPRGTRKAITQITQNTSLKMSDFDFPSAMPEKPVQSIEEQLRDSATTFIADITARLGDGVAPPPELEALKKVRDDEGSDVKALSLKIYELMIGENLFLNMIQYAHVS